MRFSQKLVNKLSGTKPHQKVVYKNNIYPKYDSNAELMKYKDPVSGSYTFKPEYKLYSATLNHKGRNAYNIFTDRPTKRAAKVKKKKRTNENRWGLPQTKVCLPKTPYVPKPDLLGFDPFECDEEKLLKDHVDKYIKKYDILADEPEVEYEVSLTEAASQPKQEVEVQHEVAWTPTNHDYIVMLSGASYTIGTIWEVIYKDHDPITIYTPTRNYPELREYTVLNLPGIYGSEPDLSINRQRRIDYCHSYLLSYSRDTLNSFTREFQDSLLFSPRSNLDRLLGRVPGWTRLTDLNPPLEVWKLSE